MASCTDRPVGSGTGTSCGPLDTWTTTVWPGLNMAPGAGSWLTTVPAGSWLLASDSSCSLMLFWLASCRTASILCPVKSGSGGPDATRIVTVLVCGQVEPAGGLVPTTVPTGRSAPACCTVEPRCTCGRAACAVFCASLRAPGTTELKLLLAISRLIVAPLEPRSGGLVLSSIPF